MTELDPDEPWWLPWLAYILSAMACGYFLAPYLSELVGAYW